MGQKVLQKMNTITKIIEIIESGDIHDPRYKLLIKSLTVEELTEMRKTAQAISYNQEVREVLRKEIN